GFRDADGESVFRRAPAGSRDVCGGRCGRRRGCPGCVLRAGAPRDALESHRRAEGSVMRPRGWSIWAALSLSPLTWLHLPIVVVKWPATRDVPWVNLLLFAVSVGALVSGLRHAFAPGGRRLLRIVLAVPLAAVSGFMLANFVMMAIVNPRRLPGSAGAPSVG